MTKAVEIFVAINFIVIGLSHLFQARGWVEFFKILSSHGRAGAFVNGFLSLTFGSIIVAFHWVWDGVLTTLVTCVGIAQIIKSLVAFVTPQISLRSMSSPAAQNPLGYQVAGGIFLVLGMILLYEVCCT